jgi:Effector-associated domain 7
MAEATAKVTLFFRSSAPRSAAAQATLRVVLGQILSLPAHQIALVGQPTPDKRLSLALPTERAIALLALYMAAAPTLDRLQLRDLVLSDGRGLPGYYFDFGPAHAQNRAVLRAVGERLLAASGHVAMVPQATIDTIIAASLGQAQTVTDDAQSQLLSADALLLQATLPTVLHLLAEALLSNDLNQGGVLGAETPLMAPALRVTELVELLQGHGISATAAQVDALADAINGAIAAQLLIPQPAVERQRLASVRVKLTIYFSVDELHTLCFDLGVDFENLDGTTKSGKARELVGFCERHGQLEPLLVAVRRLRPHVLW